MNAATHEYPTETCPLCRTVDCTEIERASWSSIWVDLERAAGAAAPAGLRARYPSGDVVRVRCASCDLEYTRPSCPGDGDFYAYLAQSGRYYDADRWDFEVARKWIQPDDRVLDLGCGRGEFLRSLPASTTRVGIDINSAALSSAEQDDMDLLHCTPAQYAAIGAGSFDVVCSFQMIEHVADVPSVIGPAVECLRPGGVLIVSVPNRDRARINEAPALDWPPHHLSRWSASQLWRLGSQSGIDTVAIEREQRSAVGVARLGAYVAAMRLTRREAPMTLPGLHRPPTGVPALRLRHSMVGIYRRRAEGHP